MPHGEQSGGRAGCTTTTSSRSGSPRSASSGRARGTATRSTPGPSSSPTSASTTCGSPCRGASWSAPRAGCESKADNPDGTETFRFVQEDVHDFAWTASRRFLERRALFDEPGYPPVDIRLLLQPEHAHLAERYLEATKIALRTYGTWSAPYPYPQITVVDPAWGSASGGHGVPDALHRRGDRLRAPRAAEPGGRDDPRGRATSSGTASWPTTSSRRPGSTRASTPT